MELVSELIPNYVFHCISLNWVTDHCSKIQKKFKHKSFIGIGYYYAYISNMNMLTFQLY